MKSNAIMVGPGLDGKPYAVFPGAVTVLHVAHAPECPGGKGWPELCNCTPEYSMGPIDEKTLQDWKKQAAARREGKLTP